MDKETDEPKRINDDSHEEELEGQLDESDSDPEDLNSDQESVDENQTTSTIVTSMKRNSNQALKYWTKEKMESAKPIPFPKSEVIEQ